ncbi:MAG TPA: hypothetical protein VN791_05795 [Acidimicrobiales bacterium]|nr:hypothetical protein [Acidimicrobiales bacterium]
MSPVTHGGRVGIRRPRQSRTRSESRTRTIGLLGAAALALVAALVLAWPRPPGPIPARSAPPRGGASSPRPTTARTRPGTTAATSTTTTVSTTTTGPTFSAPGTSIPGGPSIPTVPSATGGSVPPAKPGSVQAATPAQKAAITVGLAHPPGPIGDVFVSASDPSYAAVEFGGGQPGFVLMQDEGGTWTEVAEGSPQIPCQAGLPLPVESDLSGLMAPCS